MCTESDDYDVNDNKHDNAKNSRCLSWYRVMKYVECALWIAILLFIVMIITVNIAVSQTSANPNVSGIKLARLNMTEMCASHCATMFIRKG
jgi:hypothetical protein